MRHVLVTGGAGFIGSHLVDAYLENGWRVSVIDDLSTGDRRNLNPAAHFYEAGLHHQDTLRLLDEIRPDVVSHHAAQIDVRRSVDDPGYDAEINVVASVRLLQKCVDIGVKRFIFASTGGAIYGEPLFTPQTEEHPTRPMSPYGCAKLAVEHYMHYFREVPELSTVALRYANVYGPRQNPKGEAGVIAIFADRLLRGQPAVINGSGAQTRDFVYVSDVVAANMAVSGHDDLVGVYNVGTAVETTVKELYAAMVSVLNTDRVAQHGPAKIGEQMRSVIDGSALRRKLGLPVPVELREGLRQTISWFSHERRDSE